MVKHYIKLWHYITKSINTFNLVIVIVSMKKYCINYMYLFILISLAISIVFIFTYDLSFGQEDDEKEEDNEEEKLVIKTRIHIGNLELENTKFLRVIGFINGQEAKQDIPVSSIDKTKKTLNVDLKVDEDNGIVEADTPDEYFKLLLAKIKQMLISIPIIT